MNQSFGYLVISKELEVRKVGLETKAGISTVSVAGCLPSSFVGIPDARTLQCCTSKSSMLSSALNFVKLDE